MSVVTKKSTTTLLVLGALVVAVFLLVPQHQTRPLFTQQSVDRTIRVNPGQAVQQRIWLPTAQVSSIQLAVMQKATLGPSVQMRLLADTPTGPGAVLASVAQTTIAFTVPGQAWVWVELKNTSSTDPLFVFREIDSSVYPGGRLVLEPAHKDEPGVLAFTIFVDQVRWISPLKGLLLLGILVMLWILVPWERLELSRA